MQKATKFQKNIYFCSIDYNKAFNCVDHNKLWKILKEMGIPDHLICLLRNLFAGQETIVRTLHETTDMLTIERGVQQGCILSPCWFKFYAELLFSCSVLSDSLWPHGLQHDRLPYSSPSPGACSNSCPLSKLCYPNIFYSVISFSACLQSFPASGSFLKNQLYISAGQSIEASASALPIKIDDSFPLELIGLISWQSKELSRVFSNMISSLCSAFFMIQCSHPYMTTGKTIALTRWTIVGKIMSLLFTMLLGWS